MGSTDIIFVCAVLFAIAAFFNYGLAFESLSKPEAESQLRGYQYLGTGVVWTVAALVFAFGFLTLTNPAGA